MPASILEEMPGRPVRSQLNFGADSADGPTAYPLIGRFGRRQAGGYARGHTQIISSARHRVAAARSGDYALTADAGVSCG
jgi:hypothetical protein